MEENASMEYGKIVFHSISYHLAHLCVLTPAGNTAFLEEMLQQ